MPSYSVMDTGKTIHDIVWQFAFSVPPTDYISALVRTTGVVDAMAGAATSP